MGLLASGSSAGSSSCSASAWTIDVQRRPPARRPDGDRRTDPRAHAGPADGDRLPAPEPLPDRASRWRCSPSSSSRSSWARSISGSFVHAFDNAGAVRRRVRRPRPGGARRTRSTDIEARDPPGPGTRPRRLHGRLGSSRSCAVEARQVGATTHGFEDYRPARPRRGIPATTRRSASRAMARGYANADEVWRALADEARARGRRRDRRSRGATTGARAQSCRTSSSRASSSKTASSTRSRSRFATRRPARRCH